MRPFLHLQFYIDCLKYEYQFYVGLYCLKTSQMLCFCMISLKKFSKACPRPPHREGAPALVPDPPPNQQALRAFGHFAALSDCDHWLSKPTVDCLLKIICQFTTVSSATPLKNNCCVLSVIWYTHSPTNN